MVVALMGRRSRLLARLLLASSYGRGRSAATGRPQLGSLRWDRLKGQPGECVFSGFTVPTVLGGGLMVLGIPLVAFLGCRCLRRLWTTCPSGDRSMGQGLHCASVTIQGTTRHDVGKGEELVGGIIVCTDSRELSEEWYPSQRNLWRTTVSIQQFMVSSSPPPFPPTS